MPSPRTTARSCFVSRRESAARALASAGTRRGKIPANHQTGKMAIAMIDARLPGVLVRASTSNSTACARSCRAPVLRTSVSGSSTSPGLTKANNVDNLVHGASLSLRGSGRLDTRLDTPHSSNRSQGRTVSAHAGPERPDTGGPIQLFHHCAGPWPSSWMKIAPATPRATRVS